MAINFLKPTRGASKGKDSSTEKREGGRRDDEQKKNAAISESERLDRRYGKKDSSKLRCKLLSL